MSNDDEFLLGRLQVKMGLEPTHGVCKYCGQICEDRCDEAQADGFEVGEFIFGFSHALPLPSAIKHICAQIEYATSEGNVHSDLCWEGELPEDHRQMLHMALDEWLDKSNGTGEFTVGNLRNED